MAQNITLLGASYPDVPAVQLPKTGGGVATFVDIAETIPVGELYASTDGSIDPAAELGFGTWALVVDGHEPEWREMQGYEETWAELEAEETDLWDTLPAYYVWKRLT